MSDTHPEQITGNLSITVLPQANGIYRCGVKGALCDRNQADIHCVGQTPEHAIAIALEQLADEYRQMAETCQSIDWDAIERSDSGEPIEKRYHVMVHYENIITAESKFEAMHNTILGNTVIENAKINVIEVANDLPLEPLVRPWQ